MNYDIVYICVFGRRFGLVKVQGERGEGPFWGFIGLE